MTVRADFAPSFEELLSRLQIGGELVSTEVVPSRPARRSVLPSALQRFADPEFLPYIHQTEAIEVVRSGESVVISTGTASGKSICYQLPIAEAVAAGETALLLFPTKALAQDQLRALATFGDGCNAVRVPSSGRAIVPVTYDGDSSIEARTWARRHGNVVLSNPDMLHAGILPFHGRWADFLHRLRYVVIDELHTYRGLFGGHVAHVMRRLRRVCAQYGAMPTFIFASATIGDPAGLAAELCGLPVRAVTEDGSPMGERVLAVWRPATRDSGVPVSGNAATAELLAALAVARHRTIAFTRSRRAAELVAAAARRHVGTELAGRIRSYRGGYLATERREIEAQLFSGQLLGVSATNALELGVDIGGLDACILNGFPGTVASFRQQVGRAGRSAQRSLAVLVAGDDALDQWYAAHPDQLLHRPAEPVIVNIANPFTLEPHVACAAHEVPLVPSDAELWSVAARSGAVANGEPSSGSEAFDDAVAQLVRNDDLVIVNGRAVWAGRGSPAMGIGLRTGGAGSEVRIVTVDETRLLGTVDAERAMSTVHTGALYLHQGQQFRVVALDLDDRAAWVEATDVDEYTQTRSTTDIRILGVDASVGIGGVTARLGSIELHEQVVGFERKRASTGRLLGHATLQLPAQTLATRAFWWEVPDLRLEDLGMSGPGSLRVPGTVHAAEHAAIGMLPLFTICDRWDVGGVSTARHEQTDQATIFIYDAYPGGAGVAELGYANIGALLRETADAIDRCPCIDGCPSCVQSPKCGNGNEPLDKGGALTLLRGISGGR